MTRPTNNHTQPVVTPSTHKETSAERARRLERELQAARDAAAREEAEAVAAQAAATVKPTLLDALTVQQLDMLLEARGYTPKRKLRRSEDIVKYLPDRDYEDTERVQNDIEALMTKQKGVVRVNDIITNITRDNGNAMTPSNVRSHLEKMAATRRLFMAYEVASVPGRGLQWVAAKDPLTLAEALDRKPARKRG